MKTENIIDYLSLPYVLIKELIHAPGTFFVLNTKEIKQIDSDFIFTGVISGEYKVEVYLTPEEIGQLLGGN